MISVRGESMDTRVERGSKLAAARDYSLLFVSVSSLPDRCVVDIAALADRIGADKLELIKWMRADIAFARVVASKVSGDGRRLLDSQPQNAVA
jgi:hypothetical protein